MKRIHHRATTRQVPNSFATVLELRGRDRVKCTAHLLGLVVLASALGCNTVERMEIPVNPECAFGCLPIEHSGVDYSASDAASAGTAVAIVKAGNAPFQQRLAVVGAPFYGSNEDGRVFVHEIVDGVLNPAPLQELVPSVTAVALGMPLRFGQSLLDTEIRADSCAGIGRELVVGLPGDGSSGYDGRIRWYYLNGDPWAVGGEYQAPEPSSQFGFSLAAPPPPSSEFQEFRWMAVGAPGDDEVFILQVRPCAEPTLDLYQTLRAPAVAEDGGYGYALSVGDFDGDGRYDLAVGAPLDTEPRREIRSHHGRVFVYRNRSGDAGWVEGDALFGSDQVAVLNPDLLPGSGLPGWGYDGGVRPQHFGEALAAGPFWTRYDRDSLVVGLPHYSPDEKALFTGAIFQAAFELIDGPGATPTLETVDFERLVNPSEEPYQRFGTALAVGQFSRCDVAQVAVGVPGFHGSAGKTAIYLAGREGIYMEDTYGDPEYALIHRSGHTPETAPSGAFFGSALSAGLVEEGATRESLLIGAYGANADGGHVTLTQPQEQEPECNDIEGIWYAVDSTGKRVEIHIDFLPGDGSSGAGLEPEGYLQVIALDRIHLPALMGLDEGDIVGCGSSWLADPVATLELWSYLAVFPWSCDATTSEEEWTWIGGSVKTTLRYDEANDAIKLTLKGNNCVKTNPILFRRVQDCE